MLIGPPETWTYVLYAPALCITYADNRCIRRATKHRRLCNGFFFLKAHCFNQKIFSDLTVKRSLIRRINLATLRHDVIEITIILTHLYERVFVLKGGISFQ